MNFVPELYAQITHKYQLKVYNLVRFYNQENNMESLLWCCLALKFRYFWEHFQMINVYTFLSTLIVPSGRQILSRSSCSLHFLLLLLAQDPWSLLSTFFVSVFTGWFTYPADRLPRIPFTHVDRPHMPI